MEAAEKKMRWPAFPVHDPVLVIAWLLAILSACFVHPDRRYLSYIDWRSLGILWGLMVVIQGMKENALFDKIGEKLLCRVHKGWQLAAVLIFLCFFSSMLITNDVALLTFVPFSILLLHNCGMEKLALPVVVLQTVAANLGSMATPIGNPQNLYLYGLTGVKMNSFLSLMLPYTGVSVALLMVSLLFLPERKRQLWLDGGGECGSGSGETAEQTERPRPGDGACGGSRRQLMVYGVLFLVALLTVLRLVPWYMLAALVFIVVLCMDRRILKRADYVLLFTFLGFFVFTGNMGRIPFVHGMLQKLVQGREFLVSVVASQCISNVPAALLLSGFTDDPSALFTGVNIGGLGTLIASMASLISYKEFTNTYQECKGSYLLVFTLVNLVFLGCLSLFHGLF